MSTEGAAVDADGVPEDPLERRSHALRLATAAALRVGLDARDAEIFRHATAVLVALPWANAVARVEPTTLRPYVDQYIEAARCMARFGVPANRLVVPDAQPVVLDGGVVTFWERLEHVGRTATPAELGVLIRQLHHAAGEATAFDLKILDPFSRVGYFLSRPGPPLEDIDALVERVDTARARWARAMVEVRSDMTLVHGDVHLDNVIVTPDGPMLVDLEYSSLGPPAYDLVPMSVRRQRYGARPSEVREFLAAYGCQAPESPLFELLCEAYELQVTAWAVGMRGLSAPHLAEAKRRMRGVLRGGAERWRFC